MRSIDEYNENGGARNLVVAMGVSARASLVPSVILSTKRCTGIVAPITLSAGLIGLRGSSERCFCRLGGGGDADDLLLPDGERHRRRSCLRFFRLRELRR